jgi:predicted kinase
MDGRKDFLNLHAANNLAGLSSKCMPTLYVLIGLPGSGKSHWAHATADWIGAVVVGSDEVRSEFQARGQNPYDGEAVFDEVEHRARAHLQANRSVILDATHYQRRHRRYALELAHQLQVPCVAIWFDTSLTEVLRRNGWRTGDRFGERRVPDHIIREMAAHFDSPGKDEFDRVVRIQEV